MLELELATSLVRSRHEDLRDAVAVQPSQVD